MLAFLAGRFEAAESAPSRPVPLIGALKRIAADGRGGGP
jgi:hypothetical protein